MAKLGYYHLSIKWQPYNPNKIKGRESRGSDGGDSKVDAAMVDSRLCLTLCSWLSILFDSFSPFLPHLLIVSKMGSILFLICHLTD